MAEVTITANELRNRLVLAGHAVLDGQEAICPIVVAPTPEAIVTVGMNLDPTLMPAYRCRYFACYLKSEEDPVPALRDDPSFALLEVARRVSMAYPGDDCFLGGPFRWLLRRIVRFDSVLLWPGNRESNSNGLLGLPEEAPSPRKEQSSNSLGQDETGAVVLDLKRESDWRILWQVASQVSQSSSDFFIADLECNEVYQMHHHGKVVASLPDGTSSQELLDELAGWSDLIEDCSNYISEWDDEDDAAT